MQTETECGNGSNNWAAARHTWDLIKHYLENGAREAPTCIGTWCWTRPAAAAGAGCEWRQNAMITIDRATRAVRYNAEYHLMRHFAAFVDRRARRLEFCSAAIPALAFVKPNGSVVVICANFADLPIPLHLELDGQDWAFDIPAQSFATITVPASGAGRRC